MKNKALIVAVSEFTTLVRSKAFLIGLLMMPMFMGVAIGVQKFTRDATDIKDRALRRRRSHRARSIAPLAGGGRRVERGAAQTGGTQTAAAASCPRQASFEAGDEQARAALSDRVKRDEIYAFVEIPARRARSRRRRAAIRYYSNHPGYRALPAWIASTINREILNQRFRTAAIDRALVEPADAAASRCRSSACSQRDVERRRSRRPRRSTRSARPRSRSG